MALGQTVDASCRLPRSGRVAVRAPRASRVGGPSVAGAGASIGRRAVAVVERVGWRRPDPRDAAIGEMTAEASYSSADSRRNEMGMRFAVVGTGYWARETHATALAAHPDANLVGVWGRSFARAAELAEAFGARPYERVDDMFADVDAVAFAVPPNVQADLAVRAAMRGCHLLLDKPVAFTTEAADRIVEAVDGAGVRSLVFLTSRFTANQADWLTDVQKEAAWNSGYVRIYGSIFESGNPFGESLSLIHISE